MSKLHGIKYPCEMCNGVGWVVHQEPTKEQDVLPITDEMKEGKSILDVLVEHTDLTEEDVENLESGITLTKDDLL